MVRSDHGIPTCPMCRSWLPADAASFCPWCGAELSPPTISFGVGATGPGTPRPPRDATRRGTVPAVLPLSVIGLATSLIVLFGFLRLWWAELVLVPATVLLVYSAAEVSWEQVSHPTARLARRLGERVRRPARAGRVWVAARARRIGVWLAARGHQARVWIDVRAHQLPVRRRHHQTLYLLGRAVSSGDDERAGAHRMAAATTGARLEHLERRLVLARAQSDERVRRQRQDSAPTQVLPAAGRAAQERVEQRR